MEIKQHHSDTGVKPALIISRGRKFLQVMVIEAAGVRLRKLPKAEERYMRDLGYRGKPYPIKRALRRFRHAGKTLGISKPAKRALT